MLTRLAEIPVREVHKVGDKRAEALAGHRHHERPRPPHPLPAPLHRPHPASRRGGHADGRGVPGAGHASTPVRARRTRQGRALVELDVDDGTGALRVTFFNQAWRARQLPVGTEALFFGKLDSYRGKRQFTNPVVDLVGNRTGRIVPIYPTSEKAGIAGWEFGEWVEEALRRAGALADPLPAPWRAELELMDRTAAFRAIHAPQSFAEQERGPPPAGLRRAAPAPARSGHAPARARARRPGHPPRRGARRRRRRPPRRRLRRPAARSP